MGLGMPRPRQNWLSPTDLYNVLNLAGHDLVGFHRREFWPRRAFGLGTFVNRIIGSLPFLNKLCWRYYAIARSRRALKPQDYSVTVLIPCRNEKGNIESCVRRLPEMGTGRQEILFVEGGSSDGTYEECLRVKAQFSERNIHVIKQMSKGKGDAVRLGFLTARGQIVMILDSDLAVPPEFLPRVYAALADGTAEFVNCTRLIYPMSEGAMRPLNYVANRVFANVISYLIGQKLTDTLCGTKALFKDDYARIDDEIQRRGSLDPFGDFDLLFGAARHNLHMVEIPIRYVARVYGTTQISRFSDGWRLLRMVWYAFWEIKAR
jgi:glycosyltransferase involved in cell wall biosynthesis